MKPVHGIGFWVGTVLMLACTGVCQARETPQAGMEPLAVGCMGSKVTLDTSSVEGIYSEPGQILADADGFWKRDPAYRYARRWHEGVGVPVRMDEWKAEIGKLASLSATQRQGLPAPGMATSIQRDAEAFLEGVREHICGFLPPRDTVDLSTTVYLSAHLAAYAFMTDTNIVVSVDSPHWKGSASLIRNTIVHEVFHIGYGKNRFLRSEDELIREDQYRMLDALHNEGLATYVADRIRSRFPADEDPDHAMLADPATVRSLVDELNRLFSGSAGMKGDELSKLAWQVGVKNRAYYVVGAHMARTIDQERGRAALIETIERGPLAFVDVYNGLVERPLRVFRFEAPDSTSVFSQMKRAVTDDDRSSLAILVQKLRKDPPQDASTEKKLDRLGFRAIFLGRPGMAVDVLSLNVDLFPRSANAHDSLGEACWRNRDVPGAIRHYRRSLELDPYNENAQRMLTRLKAGTSRGRNPTPER